MATILTNSRWRETKPELKKGMAGEEYAFYIFASKGYILYAPINNGSHGFDAIAYKDGKYQFAIEVKSKPMCKKYPETGIDYYIYERYLRLSSELSLPVFLVFVDEDCGEIYGNFLHELDKPISYQGMDYPKTRTWKGGINKMRYFPKCHMKHLGDLRKLEVEYLKILSRSNFNE